MGAVIDVGIPSEVTYVYVWNFEQPVLVAGFKTVVPQDLADEDVSLTDVYVVPETYRVAAVRISLLVEDGTSSRSSSSWSDLLVSGPPAGDGSAAFGPRPGRCGRGCREKWDQNGISDASAACG